jgi:CheY-like chemotaxis protein
MSGQQLYQRIAESDQGLTRRIIFMTGDTVSADTSDFLAASGNPTVNKPFNLEELHQQILHSMEASSVSR